MSNSDSSVSFGVGLLFGVIGGVLAGVLLSPKSGEEMRRDLKEAVDSITSNVQPDIAIAKNTSMDMIDKVKLSLESQLYKINDAIKAGRMAAAKRKEELDSGYSY